MGEKSGLTQMYSLTPLMLKDVFRLAAAFLVVGAIVFFSAGRLGWVEGWTMMGVLFVCVFVNLVVLGFLNPGVLVERMQHKHAAGWDKALMLAGVLLWLGALVVAGLQERNVWAPRLPRWAVVAGLAAVVLGNVFFVWAAAVNRFFTRWVCVRQEVGHEVVREGPYRMVRHPGYLGWILISLGIPPALGAAWAWAPMACVVALIVVRTYIEDGLLRQDLPGYKDYCARTPHRLLPKVW
jgi:protein-S-isoprenylcysteine O-methyltransferase Ste14